MKFSNDATGFVNLGEAVPDILLDIRYYTSFNFIGERIDGYEEPTALMTREAARALKGASDEAMEQGFRLKVFDAYRPQKAVDHFIRWAADPGDIRTKAYFYPDLDKSQVIPQGYVAEHSGHSRGSTIDLTLFDMATQQDLDMGGTFDFFGERSHPDYTGVSAEQHENRMLLQQLMVKHGFRPIAEEWWHFTLENEPWPDTYFTFPVSGRPAG
jgi:D-alanyl-D-alanine dipeptidase